SDDDQQVDSFCLYRGSNRGVTVPVHVGIHTGGAEDGAPLIQDAPDLISTQGAGQALHQASPSLLDPDHLFTGGDHSGDHAPDCGVEPRTVAARGENTYPHLGPRRSRNSILPTVETSTRRCHTCTPRTSPPFGPKAPSAIHANSTMLGT